MVNPQSITKIGIFDSGIGGISIVKELLSFSGIEFLYVADTAHIPYGKRPVHEIKALSKRCIDFLITQGVTTIIIACHTVSAVALDFLRQEFPQIFFIGMVDLVTQQAATVTANGNIGILATKASIHSNVHKNELLKINPALHIFNQACPRLASVIEKDYINTIRLTNLVSSYVKRLLLARVDTIILGCTHYALIQDCIKSLVGPAITLVSAEQIIKSKNYPFMLVQGEQPSFITWFVTGNGAHFKRVVSYLMPPALRSSLERSRVKIH